MKKIPTKKHHVERMPRITDINIFDSLSYAFKTIIEEDQMTKKKQQNAQKDQIVALILAVVLSFWTWTYTYREDAWKFWTGIIISTLFFWMLFIPPLIIWFWAVMDTAIKGKNWFENYNK